MKGCNFLFFLLITLNAISQQVQWAGSVIKFSSEYSRTQYSAKMILGKPDKLPAWGESPIAWAPATMDNEQGEFIHVGFTTPQQIRQIAIGESNCSGAVQLVTAYDTKGKKYIVYQNDTINSRFTNGGGMMHIFMPLTDYEVKSIRVDLQTKAIPGMNQIDCIGISESEISIEAKIDVVEYNYISIPENLGPMVNSRADDMLPIITPDGKTLYFARKKHNENYGDGKRDDIWYSTLDINNNWTTAKNIGEPLNNEYHNYVAWVNANGKNIALANDYKNPGAGQRVSSSTFENGKWSFPNTLRINDMYNRNEFSCYHLNTEGNIMFLAIERGDTYGDMDIYVSFLQKNNAWTTPKNLGSVINTAATEGSVFIANDNRTLYIATNGRSGYGGFDMFMSKRLDDTWLNWSEPINLGPLINSKYDEFYYTIPASGDYAYYSSRQNTIGGADLFRIQLPKEIQPEPVALINGNVIDKQTGKKINATIEYGGLINTEPARIQTDTGHAYTLIIPEPSYFVTVTKEGYMPLRINPVVSNRTSDIDYNNLDAIEIIKHEIKQSITPQLKNATFDSADIEKIVRQSYESLELEKENNEEQIIQEIVAEITTEIHTKDEYQELTTDIEMIPIREGQILTLNNVYFDANKSVLKDASKDQLFEIAEFLKMHPNIYVEIGGHTNSLPEDTFCNQLSDARAKNVAEFIISQGISADRVTYKGYGKTLPIADNNTLEGRKKNQRVDLKIMRIAE